MVHAPNAPHAAVSPLLLLQVKMRPFRLPVRVFPFSFAFLSLTFIVVSDDASTRWYVVTAGRRVGVFGHWYVESPCLLVIL